MEDPGPIAAVGEGSTDEFTKSYVNKTQMQEVIYFLSMLVFTVPIYRTEHKILYIYSFVNPKSWVCVSPKDIQKYKKLSILDSELITVAPETICLPTLIDGTISTQSPKAKFC